MYRVMIGDFIGALGWVGFFLAVVALLASLTLRRTVGKQFPHSIAWHRNNIRHRYKWARYNWQVLLIEYIERLEMAERGDYDKLIQKEASTIGGALLVASIFMSVSIVHYFIGRIVALF